ncbi:hypothetical protein PF008_g9003 [Phytophthora fragariae]|uniref:Uncharacterized protein n=1 Tax=Phytophthora fragariae TaxID=53985 RepID=A0A6G0RY32_9STRA|nr:hypothetical protein PF008_g9003 [Phytophthora fragariae]
MRRMCKPLGRIKRAHHASCASLLSPSLNSGARSATTRVIMSRVTTYCSHCASLMNVTTASSTGADS